MEPTTSQPVAPQSLFSGKSLLILAILGTLALAAPFYFPASPGTLPGHRLKMEKSSGKNGKHANPKAREAAEREYQRVKDEIRRITEQPSGPSGKSPEEKKLLKKLFDQLRHWQKKKDFTGENHSQKAKGR